MNCLLIDLSDKIFNVINTFCPFQMSSKIIISFFLFLFIFFFALHVYMIQVVSLFDNIFNNYFDEDDKLDECDYLFLLQIVCPLKAFTIKERKEEEREREIKMMQTNERWRKKICRYYIMI